MELVLIYNRSAMMWGVDYVAQLEELLPDATNRLHHLCKIGVRYNHDLSNAEIPLMLPMLEWEFKDQGIDFDSVITSDYEIDGEYGRASYTR